MDLKLYSRYRNSAGQRVRTSLNIKGVAYEYIPISIDGGAPDSYRAVNPQSLIPALEVDGEVVTQSTALIEFIEETFDGPSLLPQKPIARARSRAFGQVIACEIHPVVGPKIQRHLRAAYNVDTDGRADWYGHWIQQGFETLEELLRRRATQTMFCYDDKPTIGDIYLVPQLYNARLAGLDLSAYPLLLELDERCRALPEFDRAMPENQPDFPADPVQREKKH
ncbi:MAG: maleylpyruvate isomerase [Gammaproteobacteria bacterium]|jgi:maleylpyruvate isomerase